MYYSKEVYLKVAKFQKQTKENHNKIFEENER